MKKVEQQPRTRRRREHIKLRVALIDLLLQVKGYAAPATKAAAEPAHLLIEQAETLGEPPEDPLLLFSVLYSFWVANLVAFDGDAMRELAAQFLALAEQQRTTAPSMIAHRLMGMSFLQTGEIAKGRAHLDRAIALYKPAEHRPLATLFGHDSGVAILCFRSLALWFLGCPEAALKDANDALKHAREIGQAATSMYALTIISFTHFHRGNYTTANAQLDEADALADEKGALFWKSWGMMQRGCVLALTGKPSDAVHMINAGITAWRSTGSTLWLPLYLSYLAGAYTELDQFDDAWRCIGEAMTAVEATKERWCEADIHRIAGEITLMSPGSDAEVHTHFSFWRAQGRFARTDRNIRSEQARHRVLWTIRRKSNKVGCIHSPGQSTTPSTLGAKSV
jgi:tetratricopeptide (TPR) repeat protein